MYFCFSSAGSEAGPEVPPRQAGGQRHTRLCRLRQSTSKGLSVFITMQSYLVYDLKKISLTVLKTEKSFFMFKSPLIV